VTAPRIYTPQPLTERAELELEQGAGRHLASVLRLRGGAEIVLFNGRGGEYRARIAALERRRVRVSVYDHDPVERESSLRLRLGIAISRGERMDWLVRKCTELGVAELSPLFSERTEVRLTGERAEKKLRHWRRIVISACEQCGRNRIPPVNPPQTLARWMERSSETCKLVLHRRGSRTAADIAAAEHIALLIGPEGGLSDAELAAATDAGFQSVSMGPRILRTETAPLAAVAILQHRWGDM